MRPRLIVSDLDGTLLDPDGSLSRESCVAVGELSSRGITFILATGRSYFESKFVLERIQSCREMIGAAGALLTDTANGQTLAREVLCEDLITRVTETILAEGHLVYLLQDRSWCAHDYLVVGSASVHPTMSWWLSSHGLRTHQVPVLDELNLSHTVRMGVIGGPQELEGLTERIEKAYGDELVIRHWQAVSKTEDQPTYLLELFKRGVDKWSMIEQVIQRDGIAAQEVAALGDGLNDIQMLRNAGLGIAMGQAEPEVKAAANTVVASNRDGGFAEAIRALLRS
jgi:hypothetical protein